MLVLSRKENEKIRIGNNIEIVITSVQGGTVRVGIDAPEEFTILREELVNETTELPDLVAVE